MTSPLARLLELRAWGYENHEGMAALHGGVTDAEAAWVRDTAAAIEVFSEVAAAKFKHPVGLEREPYWRYRDRMQTVDILLAEIEGGTVATPPAEDEPTKAAAPKTARTKRKRGRKPEDPSKRIAAVQAELDEQARRGLELNVQGAIRAGLAKEDWDKDPDPGAWEKARSRLTKRFGPGGAN